MALTGEGGDESFAGYDRYVKNALAAAWLRVPGGVRHGAASLADALRRLRAAGIALEGAFDHGVNLSLYVRDPDRNGVELYWDRPETEWPRASDGRIMMGMRPIDPEQTLRDV